MQFSGGADQVDAQHCASPELPRRMEVRARRRVHRVVVDDGVEHVLLQGVVGDVLEVMARDHLNARVVDGAVVPDDLAADELPVVVVIAWAFLEARRVVHEHLNELDRLSE